MAYLARHFDTHDPTSQEVWVAERAGGLIGLIALEPDGYLDLFFVSPPARGDGTAASLYDTMIANARARGLDRLITHASDYLKPFLLKRGWQIISEQSVDRNGVSLRRWEMSLNQPAGSQRS